MHIADIQDDYREHLKVGTIIFTPVVDMGLTLRAFEARVDKLVVIEVTAKTFRVRKDDSSYSSSFATLYKRADFEHNTKHRPKFFTEESEAKTSLQEIVEEKIARYLEVIKEHEKDLAELRAASAKLIVGTVE